MDIEDAVTHLRAVARASIGTVRHDSWTWASIDANQIKRNRNGGCDELNISGTAQTRPDAMKWLAIKPQNRLAAFGCGSAIEVVRCGCTSAGGLHACRTPVNEVLFSQYSRESNPMTLARLTREKPWRAYQRRVSTQRARENREVCHGAGSPALQGS